MNAATWRKLGGYAGAAALLATGGVLGELYARSKRPAPAATAEPSGEPVNVAAVMAAQERDKREQQRIDNMPKRCRLSREDDPEKPVPVFERERHLDDFVSAGVKGDRYGLKEAFEGSGFWVAPRTYCLRLDGGLTRSRVRVLSGPHEGRAGWVINEWWSEQ